MCFTTRETKTIFIKTNSDYMTDKIFIDREGSTGDFLMRMPEDAVCDLYEMIVAAPLLSRRMFFQVKAHLENKYPELLIRKASPGISLDAARG